MNENLNLQKLLNNYLNPTIDNLQIIYSKLQQLQYFNSFIEKNLKGTQRESLLYLCGKFKMEHFKGGEQIFKEGDKSNDKLYIIFNGKVALMKARPQQIQQSIEKTPEIQKTPSVPQNQLAKPAPLIPQKTINGNATGTNFFKQLAYSKRFADKMKGNIIQGQTNERVQISQQEIQVLNEKYGETIRILKRGEGFGDKALLENVPRALTACAYTQDLFLLILKKDDFDLIRQQFIQQMKEKKSLIFTKFPVQGDYSSKQLEHLAYSFDVEQFQKNCVLTVDGLPKKSFYLIQYGDILIEKMINDQMTKICILTKGQLLGEEIVMNEDGCCEYNSIVLSNEATVMVIHKHEFLQKFPEECKLWVKEEYYKKSKFRKMFQSKNMESVTGIGKPKFTTAKQFIDIKNNQMKIKSKEVQERIDIGSLIEEKNSIYFQKYQSDPEKDATATLFGQDLYQSPKLGFIPRYDKINNIPLKAFKEQYLKKLCSKRRRLEFIRPPPLTARTLLTLQTNQSQYLTKIQHTHTHTQSTVINSFTPSLSQSPNFTNSKEIN
ncbi:unnamed protein product (macronuclear) [Paramecium tetraurelia]|uniref:Cyclic nucleotide-binding domain-containing protein n=1 Tax=Paramecium tetraurelia TaxID=5888 RepID=A0DYY8_PARTE|nr:uncharacterized protein GSPATT00003223001 [Paramecium tetraurelia]CAK88255.1 unnamed protein product [Paramecium tetraurelia]|eukprot:XP_001455652.1 hypothetical protein (macronuclear) [Paramecium tetraurelia strain d4-2]